MQQPTHAHQRDNRLVELRPQISTAAGGATEIEAFQSRTLRPILKLQNDLILKLVAQHFQKHVSQTASYSQEFFMQLIQLHLRRDPNLKQLLIGVVVSHFTEDELDFYLDHENVVRKRITELLTRRVEDQWEALAMFNS